MTSRSWRYILNKKILRAHRQFFADGGYIDDSGNLCYDVSMEVPPLTFYEGEPFVYYNPEQPPALPKGIYDNGDNHYTVNLNEVEEIPAQLWRVPQLANIINGYESGTIDFKPMS